ncbi:NAD-dependent epimerase/dehydratase family protein [Vibrio cyclitrophicus]
MQVDQVLVTGSSGFIGRALIDKYQDLITPISREDRNDFLNYINNITSPPSCIIHLAGLAHGNYSKDDVDRVNHEETVRFARLAAFAGVKRFIYISSVSVLGRSSLDLVFDKNSIASPHTFDGSAKYSSEIDLKKIGIETGLEVVIIRPVLVYGNNAPGNFGSLTEIVKKSPLLPFGLTNNKRDFISVHNLVDLIMLCTKHPKAAKHTFLASDSETVSIKEFTNAIAKGLGKKVYQLPVPVCLMRFVGKLLGKSVMVEQLVGHLQVDSSDLQKVLGWTPPYTMDESMALLKKENKEGI